MYAHDVRVTRPSGAGVYTGADFAPAPDLVLYSGKADVQDYPRRAVRDNSGRPMLNFDAKVFFPAGAMADALFAPGVKKLRHDAKVRVQTPAGVVREGRVSDVRELDQTMMVRWLEAA